MGLAVQAEPRLRPRIVFRERPGSHNIIFWRKAMHEAAIDIDTIECLTRAAPDWPFAAQLPRGATQRNPSARDCMGIAANSSIAVHTTQQFNLNASNTHRAYGINPASNR